MVTMTKRLEFEEIFGGYSGARLFRFQLGGTDYCLKVPKRPITPDDIAKFREICEIYQKNGIKSLEYLGYGYNDNTKQRSYLYRYISGQNLKTLVEGSYTLAATHQAGVTTGLLLRKLRDYPVAMLSPHIPRDNMNELTERGNQLYKQLLNTPQLTDYLWQSYQPAQLQALNEIFNQAAQTFRTTKPHLIHGDIKCSNIIIDQSGDQCLIDIAAMRVSYDVVNFRYQMTWNLLPDNHQRRAFAQGFFDGLYDYQRPTSFYQQVNYITILNFLEHSLKFADDAAEIEWYFQKMQPVFADLLAGHKPFQPCVPSEGSEKVAAKREL